MFNIKQKRFKQRLWLGLTKRNKSEEWSLQRIFQFNQLERKKPEKIRASTGFEPMTSAIPVQCSYYQLSCEATHWERGQFIRFISPVRSEMMLSIYEIIHISRLWLHMIAVNFAIQAEEASSFQLLKLENSLRWSLFTFMCSHGANMNYRYFIYTSHQKGILGWDDQSYKQWLKLLQD